MTETDYSMQAVHIVLSIFVMAIAGGIVAACFARRLPASGRVALCLLLMPVISILILPLELPHDVNRICGGALFFLSVPFCLAYSICAVRRSSQRRSAIAGLAGSILFSLAYLLMMPQAVYFFVREFTGQGFVQ